MTVKCTWTRLNMQGKRYRSRVLPSMPVSRHFTRPRGTTISVDNFWWLKEHTRWVNEPNEIWDGVPFMNIIFDIQDTDRTIRNLFEVEKTLQNCRPSAAVRWWSLGEKRLRAPGVSEFNCGRLWALVGPYQFPKPGSCSWKSCVFSYKFKLNALNCLYGTQK